MRIVTYNRFGLFHLKEFSRNEVFSAIKNAFFTMDEYLHPSTDYKINSRQDISYILGSSVPVGDCFYERSTVLVELKPNIEETFKQFPSTTKNEINQILKMNAGAFTMDSNPSKMKITAFKTVFKDFAKVIGMDGLDENYLTSLQRSGALYISDITDESGNILIFHVYRVSQDRPELLHSYRNVFIGQKQYISKVNRYCHWLDMCHFAKAGFTTYDFGGFYKGDDEKHLNINKFKLSFGGNVTVLFNSILYNSRKAKLFKKIKGSGV